MSGIEVTGIALAVFPLLMKSVKMTKLGIGEMKKAVKYRVLLKDMLQDLSTESAIFENTLEYLLLRSCIFESEAHLKELIRDPGGDAWKHPEYELALQRFLAKSYDTYLQLIESMRINLEALTKRLKELEPPDACNDWDNAAFWSRRRRQIKVSLNHQELIDNLEQVRKLNSSLNRLVVQRVYLEPMKSNGSDAQRPAADFSVIREQYSSLHRSLELAKFWTCECLRPHLASLRLDAKPRSPADIAEDGIAHPPRYNFQLLLAAPPRSQKCGELYEWRAFEVSPVGFTKKNWAFTRLRHPYAPPETTAIPTSDSFEHGQTALALSSLYALMHAERSAHSPASVGYLVDEHSQDLKHELFPLKWNVQAKPVPLRTRLEGKRASSPSSGLARGDRLRIALILASSVIQLGETPWLPTFWTSEDIILFEDEADPSTTSGSDESCPHLSWSFSSSNTNLHDGFDLPEREERRHVRSRSILALGLTLVELCLGMKLSDMCEPEDVDESSIGTKLSTAGRMLTIIEENEGRDYCRLVAKCLHCNFDVQKYTLKDNEIQVAMFREVVEPLHRMYDIFIGRRSLHY